ncbi:valine--tRNA ligase, partial [Candidatus Woesearchaeota archaeon]|nr:valine--tRNA ligase [Candidatus Woesearchaeota archaeon]
ITFWLFNTVVKSVIHNNTIPWNDVMINGFVLDPKGKKMSKSKGNTIDPKDILSKYGADSLRFWAAATKLGDDIPFKEKEVLSGKKTVIKLWNASKFTINNLKDWNGEEGQQETIDKWILSKLHDVIKTSTENFEKYDYSKTKAEVEKFFWITFCDNYLELVKERIYNPETRGEKSKQAAQHTLFACLLNILKLAAPIMPHITDEVYQNYFREKGEEDSIHLTAWPTAVPHWKDEQAEQAGNTAIKILSGVRKIKSEKQVSLKKEITKLTIECDQKTKKLIQLVEQDIKGTVLAQTITYGSASIEIDDNLKIDVELAE